MKNIYGENNPNWKGGLKQAYCLQCGKLFKYKYKNHKGKYCSLGCAKIGNRGWKMPKKAIEKTVKKNREIWAKRRIQKKCLHCGKIFSVKKSRNFRKYCSHECFSLIHGEQVSGCKGGNWRGGITPVEHKRYETNTWKKTRNSVYKRDNWTCQICGGKCDKKNKIQCHHIVPYRITQDNSEGNLITLCSFCHHKEEWKYYHNLNGQMEINFAREDKNAT